MATQIEQLLEQFESFKPQYLVYENEDDALMFSFEVIKSGKSYVSRIVLDFIGLNLLIGKLQQSGYDLYDAICSKIFDSNDRYREYTFQDITIQKNYLSHAA